VSTDDDAVRDYLCYVADPTSVQPDTTDIDARIEAATDPLERVKLRSERSRLEEVGPTLEAAFVAHVVDWAEVNRVDAEALLAEGVERRVLVEAGLLSGTPRRAAAQAASGRSSSAPGRRSRPRVTRDAIDGYVRGLREGTTFTTATLTTDVGGSAGTIRKVIDALVEEGVATESGKDHSGPGRPRVLYQRT
jgi:hypothetical protein